LACEFLVSLLYLEPKRLSNNIILKSLATLKMEAMMRRLCGHLKLD